MTTSVVVVCYAKPSFIRETVEAVIEKTKSLQLILVDNHSPFDGVREYIQEIKSRYSVTVVDKGRNLGCHQGFNAGFEVATGDYLVKLDDDTVVDTMHWDEVLIETMQEYESLYNQKVAYISANHDCKIAPGVPVNDFRMPKHYFQKWSCIINFPCILMPKSTYQSFGPFVGETLYGGEEGYYYRKSTIENMAIGFGMDAKAFHKGDQLMDMDYTLWKVRYGFIGDKKYSFEELKNNKDLLIENAKIVLASPHPLVNFKEIAVKRLAELE